MNHISMRVVKISSINFFGTYCRIPNCRVKNFMMICLTFQINKVTVTLLRFDNKNTNSFQRISYYDANANPLSDQFTHVKHMHRR